MSIEGEENMIGYLVSVISFIRFLLLASALPAPLSSWNIPFAHTCKLLLCSLKYVSQTSKSAVECLSSPYLQFSGKVLFLCAASHFMHIAPFCNHVFVLPTPLLLFISSPLNVELSR